MRFLTPILLSLALASPALAIPPPRVPVPHQFPLYLSNTWECRSSDGAQTITMVVGRIDETDLGTIVSVSIRPKAGQVGVSHLAIWARMATSNCFPAPPLETLDDNFEDGYRQWREAFDAKKADAWDLPPGDAYATLLKQMPAKP